MNRPWRVWAAGILFVWLLLPLPALATCSGTCPLGDSDCSSNACHYCDDNLDCADCCDLPDEDSCGLHSAACNWDATSGKCQNTGMGACGASVAEVPKGFKYYFFGALLSLSLTGLSFVGGRRKKTAKKD